MRRIHTKGRDDVSYIFTKRSLAEKVVFGVIFVLFSLYAASILFPVLWLALNSLQDSATYAINLSQFKPFAIPKKLYFSNYVRAFTTMSYKGTNFLGMLFNSLWYVAFTVLPSVLASTITGYCISKYRFRGRGVLYAVIIFSITVPIVGAGGAYFKLIKDLGLYDSPLYVLIANFYGFTGQFLIMYGVFKNISWNYAEAVFIDGGGHYTVFFKIMLPQALPVVLTLVVTATIAAWNQYTSVLLYLPSYPTVASGLYLLSLTFVRFGGQTLYYAGLIISILPMIVIFVCFSGSLMKNMSIGGLKG